VSSSRFPYSAQVRYLPLLAQRRANEEHRVVRVSSFSIRAALANSDSAGEDKGLVIADIVLFSVGFSGVLLSAIELIFDR
jgi:hypothetical protein